VSDGDSSERTTTACPACDATSIKVRNPDHICSDGSTAQGWYCYECDSGFDEPIRRERRRPNQTANSRNGLAGDLAAADPEEVFGDD